MKVRLCVPKVTEDERNAVERVLSSGRFVAGEENSAFEKEFEDFCHSRHAIAVSNGTAALYMALQVCGVGFGDEVITVSYTFAATVEAIMTCGATPVLVDIDPRTYTMSVKAFQQALTEKTRAVIPVHLYGHPVDMDPLLEVAAKKGIKVIEDASQAHGAKCRGRIVGSMGDVACFSFYPSKNMTVLGEGGMVTTNDEGLVEPLRMMRNHGRIDKYLHGTAGMNYRLSEVHAAIGRVQLKRLDANNTARREVARWYGEALKGVTKPVEAEWAFHVYHLYVIQANRRDELASWLSQHGVETGVHYPVPNHQQPYYVQGTGGGLRLPVTEAASKRVLSLPMYPDLSSDEVEYVVECVNAYEKQSP